MIEAFPTQFNPGDTVYFPTTIAMSNQEHSSEFTHKKNLTIVKGTVHPNKQNLQSSDSYYVAIWKILNDEPFEFVIAERSVHSLFSELGVEIVKLECILPDSSESHQTIDELIASPSELRDDLAFNLADIAISRGFDAFLKLESDTAC